MERSVKRRVTDAINEHSPSLVYIDTPWPELGQGLLQTIDDLNQKVEDRDVRIAKLEVSKDYLEEALEIKKNPEQEMNQPSA